MAHARDLIYVSPLVRKYNDEEKIIQTWFLAEHCGINTMTAWPSERTLRILREYRRRGGKIQWLSHIGYHDLETHASVVASCVDNGAVGIYIAGDHCDRLVFEGKIDEIAEAVDIIKKNNLFAGVACHPIRVVTECEERHVNADFYMKTLHHDNYWSANPPDKRTVDVRVGDPAFMRGRNTSGQYHDNMWCIDADETIEYMKDVAKPWMAFKVLAAGAIGPADGFKYAFENGADFIQVGMFDFEIVDNINTCLKVLADNSSRIRSWYG